MSPRAGRPLKNEIDKKVIRLQIRLTLEQDREISELSQKLNLSKTDTILKAIRLLAAEK